MKKIFFFFIFFFSFLPVVSARQILVENIFSDIDADYEFRDELQLFFDRGMVYPDERGRFNPYSLLHRDEFVGISMEVICKRCIQPHTEFQFIERYLGEDVYYDINTSNKFFYCVAEADANDYVRGYDPSYACDDGTQRDNERPFCTQNNITLEEAIAVILRNSGLFTIQDNQQMMQDILAGRVVEDLADDVTPKNIDGSPYTFYGYFQKALDFKLVEYDAEGNEKVYTMVDIIDGKLRPKKSVTKEEFLRIAYVALKSNSCTEIADKELALAIDIWEKSCQEGDEDCTLSTLDDPDDTYDFTPDVEGFCDLGIDDPTGYIWRFYNMTNGDEFFEYGDFLDNIKLPSAGEWRVYLTVVDKCGNSGQVYSTITVEYDIDIDIEILDPNCVSGEDCDIPPVTEDECGGLEECDFQPEVETSCEAGIDEETGYRWVFTHTDSGEERVFTQRYVDNFEFLREGERKVTVYVTDECNNSAEDSVYINISDIDIDIEILDPNCVSGEDCDIPPVTEDECGGLEECDFQPEVETSCEAGIDEETGYRWVFTHTDSGEERVFTQRYVDNFEFLREGERKVTVYVTDECNNSGNATTIIVIGDIPSEIALNVDMVADPIYGFRNLFVDFQAVVTGGTPPYTYTWDFGDASGGYGLTIDHLYQQENVFEVILEVEDSQGLTGSATTLIMVVDANPCELDTDGDGIFDCNDSCSTIPGAIINSGCPIVEIGCGENCSCPDGYTCSIDDINLCPTQGYCEPIIQKESTCLYSPTKSAIFGNASCNSCPCSNYLDFLADIRECDFVFPAITSPDARSIYSRGELWQILK